MLTSYYAKELPPVEVVTDKFRGVAENFLILPIKLLCDLKAAHTDQDGSDVLILYDACEMAFGKEDFDRLLDLHRDDFLKVIRAWVEWQTIIDDF